MVLLDVTQQVFERVGDLQGSSITQSSERCKVFLDALWLTTFRARLANGHITVRNRELLFPRMFALYTTKIIKGHFVFFLLV